MTSSCFAADRMKWLESRVGQVAKLDISCNLQPSKCFEFILVDHSYAALAVISNDGAVYFDLRTGRPHAMTSKNMIPLTCDVTTGNFALGIHDKTLVAYQGDFQRDSEFIGAAGMSASFAGDLLYIRLRTNCELVGNSSGGHIPVLSNEYPLYRYPIHAFCICYDTLTHGCQNISSCRRYLFPNAFIDWKYLNFV